MADGIKQISLKLEPDLREALQREAAADQRPLAAFIRKLLRDHTLRPKPRRARAHGGQTEAAA